MQDTIKKLNEHMLKAKPYLLGTKEMQRVFKLFGIKTSDGVK